VAVVVAAETAQVVVVVQAVVEAVHIPAAESAEQPTLEAVVAAVEWLLTTQRVQVVRE
jgi:hypothetical protein